PSPRGTQSFRTEHAIVDQVLIDELPLVWMLRIEAPELDELLSRLDLQIPRQRGGHQVGFLQLDAGFAVLIELEDDVAGAFEIRIDGTIEHHLGVRYRKPALQRIVVAA